MPLFAPLLAATLAAAPAHHLTAVRVDAPPVLDGKLDDPAWKSARASSDFTQKFPHEGAAPSEKTTVAAVYDDDAIYFAFTCEQRGVPIVTRLTRRDRLVEADWVSIALDTRGDGKSAFDFTVNASGVLVDATRANDVDYSTDWDDNWDAKTQVTDAGWTAEIRIPLRILRFATASLQSWGFQARRYTSMRQETDELAPIPRSVAGEVSRYGRLDDLRGLRARSPLELRPFVLGRARTQTASPSAIASGNDLYGSAGLDLKWHTSQDLTLDATVNPDFAQVEADQVVLNLSTYEVYRPEKRPFFLEGSDILAPRIPHQLVYTRRIGHIPVPSISSSLPVLRTDAVNNEQLVDLPEPSTIFGAYKLTGRLSDRWTIGTMSAVTGENDVGVQLGNGARTKRLIEPMSSYNIVRLKRDIGDNAHLGIIGTSTTRVEPTGAYPAAAFGGPGSRSFCPDGSTVPVGRRCFHDEYTGGADYRWRSGDYAVAGQVFATAVNQGPSRTLLDGTVVGSGDAGGGGEVYVGKEGGRHYTGGAVFGGVTRKADFNDLGFMWRQNVRYAGSWVEYRTLEPWWETLETHTSAEFFGAESLGALPLVRNFRVGTQWKLRNFWQTGLDAFYRLPRYDDREVGDGTALERGGGVALRGQISTDPRARVIASASATSFWITDGYAVNGDGNLTLRVLPQFDVELLPQLQTTAGEPRYVSFGAVSGKYVFGQLAATNLSGTVRATYTFTPRLTLQSYAQLFLARGHYARLTEFQGPLDPSALRPVVHLDALRPTTEIPGFNPDFEQGALNVNVVLRWEFQLGSTLSLVYVRQQYPTVTLGPTDTGALEMRAIGRAQSTDQLYVKLVYWWG